MSAPRDARDPHLEEISAAAERARKQLHEELGEVRAGIERMDAEQPGEAPRRARSATPLLAKTGGASAALIGLVGAIGLAIPGTIAVREGLPLVGGSSLPGAPATPSSGTRAAISSGEAAGTGPPARFAAASSLPSGSAAVKVGSGSSRATVRGSSPVGSAGGPAPAGGAPGSGPVEQPPASPSPRPESVPVASTPPSEARPNDSTQAEPTASQAGDGQSVPVTAASEGESESPGRGHGRGAGPHGPPHTVPPTTSPPPWASAPSAGDEADDPGSSVRQGAGWGPNGHGPNAGPGHGRGAGLGHSRR